MDLLTLLGVVAIPGAVGGALNGWQINFQRSELKEDDPAIKEVPDGKQEAITAITQKTGERWGSLIFNAVAGLLAAAVSWAAYGPYALENIFGNDQSQYGLSLAALATAFAVGYGGPRWLSSERDKVLLKQAGADAASKEKSETRRELMQRGDPKQAAQIAGMDWS
jgi:cytochrome c biogenesis protein CcdA